MEKLRLTVLFTFCFILVLTRTEPLQSRNKVINNVKAPPDLVAVRNGSPAQMFEVGIRALGGMERFVKSGHVVAVKPNIGWNKTPGEGANTSPDLVAKIIELAYKAGAKKVYVFDHSVNVEKSCWKNSGIEKAVRAEKGEMVTAEIESEYRKVPVPGGSLLREVSVHRLYLDADVIINVPILKSHGGGRMTSALKNLMGVVWDRQAWHRGGLHQAIAEFPLVRKPNLNVIDAYTVMIANGPRGISTEDLSMKRMQILSTDILLADVAAAKTIDMPLESIAYIKLANGLKIGQMNLSKARIKRIVIKP